MTDHKKKHDAPAVASVKIGEDPFTPACQEVIDELRAKSEAAGKKALPKGATKAQVAAIVGRNGDDALPIEVRALTDVERESEVTCFAHRMKTLRSES